MDMVAETYKLTDTFPKREVYSLTDQIRRAAVSVPINIAEDQGHHSHREFRHFSRHSAGSLAELETQLLLAERLGYADHTCTENLLQRVHEVGRILNGLIASLPE
jgi:four helix bundle protein